MTIEPRPGTDAQGTITRLSHHFASVSARYRKLRELDLDAVRVITEAVAHDGVHLGSPVRLLDVATGSGRYLDAVSQHVAAALATEVMPVGLDLSLAMVSQARIYSGQADLGTRHVVGAVETLPFRSASCDVMTCFNAVHHVDLAQFAAEASRVLAPSGQLIVYTRTPAQNRGTIWGHYFPEFVARETRLHTVEALCGAVQATGAFASVRAQTVAWTVTTSLDRLVEQATHYHYSTFRLYTDDALRTAIDTFRQRVRHGFRDVTRIAYDNDHVLVIAQRLASREP